MASCRSAEVPPRCRCPGNAANPPVLATVEVAAGPDLSWTHACGCSAVCREVGAGSAGGVAARAVVVVRVVDAMAVEAGADADVVVYADGGDRGRVASTVAKSSFFVCVSD